MVRIAVLVSGGGTNLQALIDAQGRGEIPDGQIAAVISSTPDAYALERAKKAGIPGYVITRKDFASNQAMTVALAQQLKELDIGLVVLAGFMYILTAGADRRLPQCHFERPPRPHPLLLRRGLLRTPRPRGGPGLRREGHRRHRPLRQRGLRRRAHRPAEGGGRSGRGHTRGFAAAGNGAGRVEDPAPVRWHCSAPKNSAWKAALSTSTSNGHPIFERFDI